MTGIKLDYSCNDCKHKQEALDRAYNEIKGIKAYVGGHFGDSYEVRIDFESRALTWRRFDGYSGKEDYYEKIIRKDTLARFIESLKKIYVPNWKSRYENPGVCDGTQWSVELKRDDRTIRKSGDNSFPENWDEFCRLVRRVSGKPFR